jgi:hypothetical protein
MHSDDDTTPVSGSRPDTGSSMPATDPPETGSRAPRMTPPPPTAPRMTPPPASAPRTTPPPPPATAPRTTPPPRPATAPRMTPPPAHAPADGGGSVPGLVAPDVATTPDAAAMAGSIARLAESDLDASERRRLLGRLAGQLRSRGVSDTFKPTAAMRWVADAVGDVVPHLPIRSRETLRQHFPGMTDDEIADRLVRNASRAAAAIGAAGGGIAAVEWVATPTLLTAPILLAAETVAVVTVEIKLIGELHEVYGVPTPGSVTQRGVGLMSAWAHRRGVNPMMPGVGVAAVLGTAARRDMRDRLLRRFGRNLTSYGPMLTGAAVASYLNRRATLSLADEIRKDLRGGKRRKIIDSR